jgi:hypothetical protein
MNLRNLLRSSRPISELGNVIGKFATNLGTARVESRLQIDNKTSNRIAIPSSQSESPRVSNRDITVYLENVQCTNYFIIIMIFIIPFVHN